MTAEEIRVDPGRSRGGAEARLIGSAATTARSSRPRSCGRGWRGRLRDCGAPGSPWQNGYAESFHSKVATSSWMRGVRERTAGRRWVRSGRRSTIQNARTVP